MTPKWKFLLRYPNATAERQRENSGRVYWLVRRRCGDYMPFAHGDTAAKAWAAALAKLGQEGGE